MATNQLGGGLQSALPCMDGQENGKKTSTSPNPDWRGVGSPYVGINVVPLELPPAVKFRSKGPHIPWNDPTCANSELTVIGGKVTQAHVDLEPVTRHASANVECAWVLWEKTTTLRQALIDCTAKACSGLFFDSFQPMPTANAEG